MRRTGWSRPSASIALAAMLAAAGPAAALNLTDLYTTQAIVTGTGEANRQPGLQDCLRKVVAKVSGNRRLLEKPALADALAEAGSYLSEFRYRDRMEGIPIHDEQGTHDRPHDLTCVFDRDKVDALLWSLGGAPWLEERPRLVVFLAVKNDARQFLLARDGPDGPYMRDSLLAAAAPLALPVALPDVATFAAAGLTPHGLVAGDRARIAQTAARYDGALALVGRLAWSDDERGWVADWWLEAGGKSHSWHRRGVSFDDAFRDAMSGSLLILSGGGGPD